MFAGKRHFRELLLSDERIASNILSDRLNMLVEQGVVTRSGDPTHRQKAIYRLTKKGVELLPVLAQIGIWSRRHEPIDERLAATSRELEAGGPALWAQMMDDLLHRDAGVAVETVE